MTDNLANPTRRGFLFGSAAIVTVGLAGKAFAQMGRSPDDVLIRLYRDTDERLLHNKKLRISHNESVALIDSTIAGPSAQQAAVEAAQHLALDRAALPLIRNYLNPQAPLSAAEIDKAFNGLLKYLATHTKNIVLVVESLQQAGHADAALMFALVDDLKQGGSLAGFNAAYGGSPEFKRGAVLDHYTGLEAGKVIAAKGIDICIQRDGYWLETNSKKQTIDIPGWYLRQQEVQLNVGHAIRQWAAEEAFLQNPPTKRRYPTYQLVSANFNLYRTVVADDIRNGRAIAPVAGARQLFLPIVEQRLAKPPEPEPARPANAKAKPAPRKRYG